MEDGRTRCAVSWWPDIGSVASVQQAWALDREAIKGRCPLSKPRLRFVVSAHRTGLQCVSHVGDWAFTASACRCRRRQETRHAWRWQIEMRTRPFSPSYKRRWMRGRRRDSLAHLLDRGVQGEFDDVLRRMMLGKLLRQRLLRMGGRRTLSAPHTRRAQNLEMRTLPR